MIKVELAGNAGVPTDIASLGGGSFVVGTSVGLVLRFDGEGDKFVLAKEWPVYKSSSVRRLAVRDSGLLLVTSSKGKLSTLCLDTGKVESVVCEQKLGVVSALASDGATLYVGNDDGDVHCCALSADGRLTVNKTYDHHDDYISSLLPVPVKKTVLVGSGDGTMSVIDLKRGKATATTKNFDDDVTTLQPIGDTGRVALGTGGGAVKMFKWNYWGAPCGSLKAKLHGFSSINDLLAVGTSAGPVLATASGEGKLGLFSADRLVAGIELFSVDDSLERLAYLPPDAKRKEGHHGSILAIAADEAAVHIVRLTDKLVRAALAAAHEGDASPGDHKGSDSDSDSGEDESSQSRSQSQSQFEGEEERQPAKKSKKDTKKQSAGAADAFFADLN